MAEFGVLHDENPLLITTIVLLSRTPSPAYALFSLIFA
jgi:hypothetical protein